MSHKVYTIDTSAIIDLWKQWYAIDVFPCFWDICLPELINNKRLFSTKDVYDQLEDPDIKEWAKINKKMFYDVNANQINNIKNIQRQFMFDDYVDLTIVAQAMDFETIVITSETRSGNKKKAKIPNACDHFGIESLLEKEFIKLFRNEGWVFRKENS